MNNQTESFLVERAVHYARELFGDREQASILLDVYDIIKRAKVALDKPGYFVPFEGTEEDFIRLQDIASTGRMLCTMTENDGSFLVELFTPIIEVVQNLSDDLYLLEHQDERIETLDIDLETYSNNSITFGVYKYVEASDFEILLFCYSINSGPTRLIDLTCGEKLPQAVESALWDPAVIKRSHNATFERICISHYFHRDSPVEQWECSMVLAARMGLPLQLSQIGEVLNFDKKKMEEGKELIKLFCCPQTRTTKKHPEPWRVYPTDEPKKWEQFKKYCIRDVDVEKEIIKKISWLPISGKERLLYNIDAHINDRGALICHDLAVNAERMGETYKQQLVAEAIRLTGIANPKSTSQVKDWLETEIGEAIESLNKKNLPDVKDAVQGSAIAERLLEIRSGVTRTSTKKYTTMLKAECADGRLHGMLQFYGAVRTGRWAGRIVQLQNLPQNHLKDLGLARNMVLAGDLEDFEDNFSDVPDILSQLIRTAFVAPEGKIYHVCDFSAIEARVIAWVAGEEWVLEVFRTTGKIYEATAAKLYHCTAGEIDKTDPRRQKGKIASLALGYEGGIGSMKTMGGDRMGLSEEEMKTIVRDWRNANPNIVKLWRNALLAAVRCIETGEDVTINRNIKFWKKKGCLLIRLPSGRSICYPRAQTETEFTQWGDRQVISYEGMDQITHKWTCVKSYGGKLVENIVQAIARDILGEILIRAEERGYPVVFHIHDEVIVEADPAAITLTDVEKMFSEPIDWADGLPLKGAGYSTPYYLKD